MMTSMSAPPGYGFSTSDVPSLTLYLPECWYPPKVHSSQICSRKKRLCYSGPAHVGETQLWSPSLWCEIYLWLFPLLRWRENILDLGARDKEGRGLCSKITSLHFPHRLFDCKYNNTDFKSATDPLCKWPILCLFVCLFCNEFLSRTLETYSGTEHQTCTLCHLIFPFLVRTWNHKLHVSVEGRSSISHVLCSRGFRL